MPPVTPTLSADLAFEDFLNRMESWTLYRERVHLSDKVVRAIEYQRHTDHLVAALRSGSRVRLEAAVLSTGMAA